MEFTTPTENIPAKVSQQYSPADVALQQKNGIFNNLYNLALPELLGNLIGAAAMLNDASEIHKIYLATGYTDLAEVWKS